MSLTSRVVLFESGKTIVQSRKNRHRPTRYLTGTISKPVDVSCKLRIGRCPSLLPAVCPARTDVWWNRRYIKSTMLSSYLGKINFSFAQIRKRRGDTFRQGNDKVENEKGTRRRAYTLKILGSTWMIRCSVAILQADLYPPFSLFLFRLEPHASRPSSRRRRFSYGKKKYNHRQAKNNVFLTFLNLKSFVLR